MKLHFEEYSIFIFMVFDLCILFSILSFLSSTIIHRYPVFSARYSVMFEADTGYHGTSEIEHGLCACAVDNPSLKLGDYLSVQAHKPCSISHKSIIKQSFNLGCVNQIRKIF